MKIKLPSYIEEIDLDDYVISHVYSVNDNNKIEAMVNIEAPLPVEKRIFDDIDVHSIKIPRVHEFIQAFTNELRNTETSEITMSKMRLVETEDGNELEWIYSYFRIYFSFEADGDDTCGFVENNTESGSFRSSFDKMKQEEYSLIARKSIDFVINLIKDNGLS